jgi:hypothetical protein
MWLSPLFIGHADLIALTTVRPMVDFIVRARYGPLLRLLAWTA